MPTHSIDLGFPECCTNCPHLKQFNASCTHDLRQSLVSELDSDQACPVYTVEKTKAMQRLADRYRN